MLNMTSKSSRIPPKNHTQAESLKTSFHTLKADMKSYQTSCKKGPNLKPTPK